jgi:hypothetical protein
LLEILSQAPHILNDEDRESIYDFTIASLKDEDPLVASRSVLTLGIVAKESDITTLEKIALEEKPGASEPAIISLGRLCFSSSLTTLKSVRARPERS